MEIVRTLRLDKLNKKGYAPIRITAYYEGKRVFFSSGESVEPRFWDERKQKVRGTESHHLHKNKRLDDMEAAITDVYYAAVNAKETLSEDELRVRVERLLLPPGPAQPQESTTSTSIPQAPAKKEPTFFELFDAYLHEKSAELSPVTKRRIARSTIVGIAATKQRFIHFAALRKHPMTLPGMDLTFYKQFRDYMLTEAPNLDGSKGQGVNTFSKHVRRLKTFLAWCEDRDLPVNPRYRKFEAVDVYVGVDALTPAEVRMIRDYDFRTDAVREYILKESMEAFGRPLNGLQVEQRTKVLEECRDGFLFAVATGLSISDAFSVTEADHVQTSGAGHGDVLITSRTKTANICHIPLVDDGDLFRANEIMARYRGRQKTCIPVNWDINKHLKDIARLCGLKSLPVEDFSFHVARKTFVTLKVYQGLPTRLIMQATGHKTEASFNRYLGVNVDELVKQYRRMIDAQKVA